MSSVHSAPENYGGYESFQDSHMNPDVAAQMKVPKRIRVSGQNDHEPSVNWDVYNGMDERVSMNVPERILVSGGDNHVGVSGVPREVELEQQTLPQTIPTLHRVNTPPRSITLDSYSYPSVNEEAQDAIEADAESSSTHMSTNVVSMQSNIPDPMASEATLTSNEELELLRRQVGRLDRRIMTLELDSQQRTSREMFMFSLSLAYFVIKALVWVNRS